MNKKILLKQKKMMTIKTNKLLNRNYKVRNIIIDFNKIKSIKNNWMRVKKNIDNTEKNKIKQKKKSNKINRKKEMIFHQIQQIY